ncbi:uncharacterized protein LOC114522942 [Dendronephthya gigantea]|uniref:uncharacterized protein LOC114522942 n=1 Tax=Dendronephthya gigantea TaxID=151771 RepID=UPI00106B5DA6|nr:uncharacterized protein LOC114522942 [Dendronephthya gigantea]
MSWLFHRWLVLCGVSLLVIKDSCEFFLRQTETSECIAPEDSYLGFIKYAKRYWVRMVDNCLKSSAQFRYINKTELIHNIDKRGSLICIPGDRTYGDKLLVYDGVSAGGKTFENDKSHNIKQNASGSLFFYERKYCVQSNGTGARVIAVTEADCSNARNFTFGSVTQFGDKMKDVHCSSKQRMVIHKANYGDFNNGGSFNTNATVDIKCSQRASCEVKRLCGGNRSCELIVDNNLLSSQQCPDKTKELFIEYTCVDNYMNPITTAPNIRLSKSASEGFIEIRNVSTWRKVKEEIWDIIRENSLCQHLGFNGTLGNVAKTRGIKRGQEIASGNLCYDAFRQDKCCVHLYPSTTTSTVDAPYVTCKICMDPLLQNKTKFPDAIFSGSGSADNTKYKEARFSSDGWCPTESGDKYLKIDLQNEYHITRVMVMGDKNQTKWSGSYSLKYSHDESLVDGSSEVQINGNQNGYQASATDVDIHNARYIKLESNESADFCLRIKVCGEIQKPAPVQRIVAEPSFYSVNLSWTIPVAKKSSYITHFIIYLNGTKRERISRVQHGNNFILRGLKPNTYYQVGIMSQDGYSKKAIAVYKSYKTKRAGFFLRHTQSEKCLAAETPTFRNNEYGTRYWIEMVTNCLSDFALFRYLDNEVLHNIETEGNVVSEYGLYSNRLFIYDGKNKVGRNFANSTKHRMKQTTGGSLYLYNVDDCVQPSVQYVDVKGTSCTGVAAQKITFGSVTQYGDKMKDVHCSPIQRMVIHKAHYGDFIDGATFNAGATIDKKCSRQASCEVKSLCGGNRSCELTIDNNLLSSPYCPDTTKELYIEYTCVDNYMSPITTAPNMRLSKSPNEGFIEINDGSTWRKVIEEIWDISLEKSLCQHLGFKGTVGSIVKTEVIEPGREIASGDLCYDVPQNERCCVHLNPSTTTTTVKAPYVKCKICENALLQNHTKFPDTILSGSGSADNTKYKEARFSSDGWCPTESGHKYLKIDLQNEYHITRVVVMGDKAQKSWGESYSLKYSHNESLVDENRAIKVIGNQNSHQASTTDVDIYNTRYIMITPNITTRFCLRIDLCGEAQTPAKVTKFMIKPSDYSAHLSWNIPGPNESSYITHYGIYLNGTEVRKISRAMYGSQYTLRGLKPYKNYTVGIQTQDGNSQNSLVEYKTFTTKEAGKICENALLQNHTKFPDEIFSGSGSSDNTKYKEARFSSDGWCPTESGDKYLKIDLQSEYHITRVVVMGDKDQTKWSGSYSLKYSHDESLVDGGSSLQITGNLYGFQASTTAVDIYNVRYIKIHSTENTDFCLRIELCGEVQYPAPVQNVVAKPSNFSVHLSWTIPSPEASTFITHYIIYLNGTEVKRISRAYYANQYILRELTPNTNYVVGIKTQDGQLKNTQTIVYHKFKTKEAVPSGAPRSVMIKSRSKNSLEISWRALDKIFWNGELVGYQICFSIKKNDESPKCSNTKVLSTLSYVISNLIPSTKYFVTVSAGTKIGFGNKSSEISEITNGEPVNPVLMSHFDLGLTIPKAAPYIREVLIIVQRATSSSQTPSENIKTSKLGPYQSNTKDFYITAYLRADVLPLSFVIGDGKKYNYENVTYVNQPLQPNTSYNVFLRFFESQNSYYSTGWSKSIKTKLTPGPSGPPLDVSLKSRGKYTLEVSWEAPEESSTTGELTGYQVCFHTNETPLECIVLKNTKVLALTLKKLQPSTKYFVTVAASTKAGYGEKSSVVSKITNGEPLNPLSTSYYTLTLNIPKAANYIRQVMVIVQKATGSSLQSENIETSKLKAYQTNTQDPYVTAYLSTDDLPLPFVIGDGKEYNFKTGKYLNQPLTTNSSYIVFLRYFESQDSYYSTEWSSSFKTIAKAPAVCLKSNICKKSVDFLIPLIILALCFLVSLGVIVYQRRLLQNKDVNHGYGTSKQTKEMKEFDSISKDPRKNKSAKYDQRTQNDETVYETPDDVIEEIERNEGARSLGTEKEQESLNYMSLQDKKEPANVYQALQPPVTNDNQRHTKKGGQSVEYQNPAFNADFSGE